MEGQLLHASGARPSFAVASIRPECGDEEAWPARRVQVDSFQSTKRTLKDVIMYAYGIAYATARISGGPEVDGDGQVRH